MGLRLGFHYHIPATRDSDGRVLMPGFLGRFVDSLAEFCEEVVCFQHLPQENSPSDLDYRIQSSNVRLVPLDRNASVPRRFAMAHRFVRPIRQSAGDIDLLLVRGPSPLLPAAIAAARPQARTALLLVGDYLKGVYDLPQPRWRKELIRLWSRWNKIGQDRAAASSLTFVNSEVLYEEYRDKALRVARTRTTTLRSGDIREREEPSSEGSFHVLYTGRIDSAKGILDIAEAVRLLSAAGYDVVFDLVGRCEKGDPVLADLKRFAEANDLRGRIRHHGYKALGPELFQHYLGADVYVIASRGSEGFPRTIWEAMAHGTPVVATRVGSIPRKLEHRGSALLVEPRNPKGIAESIRCLIDDSRLRARLVRNGYALARASTLEKTTPQMIAEIEDFIAARDLSLL